jgi:hypothetical protein
LKGWRIDVEFEMTGRGIVRGNETPRIVELKHVPPESARWDDLPTQVALRKILQGNVLRDVYEWLAFTPLANMARPWIEAIDRGRRSGRSGKQLRFWAIWAQRRVEAEEAAPRRTTKWLAERYGETEGAVNMLVHRARNAGLLEGKPPRLTDLAEELLRDHEGGTD